MAQSKYPYYEFSGAVQQKSTAHIKATNEVRNVKNADFSTIIGAILRRKGTQSSVASLPKLPIISPVLGGYIARFPGVNEIWAAQNDHATTPTESTLSYWTGPGVSDWSEIKDGLAISAEINMTDDVDEVWVSHYLLSTDTIGESFTVDSTHNVSTSRQLAYGPSARFFMEFNGSMWAADCLIGSSRYRDRLYKSSGPTGAITFIRSPQTDPAASFDIVNQVPIMTSATTPTGVVAASSTQLTNDPYKAFDSLTTSITKWLAGATTGWLSYDFGIGNTKVITYYSIVGVPTDEGGETDRAPKTWTFEGSNNNIDWTVLNTQTNVAVWTPGLKRTYPVTNTTAYRYYRINVTLNQGDPAFLSIAEAEFMTSSAGSDLLELQVDSVRYLKPGMEIDIYTAGTETKIYDIIISSVNKTNDTISFIPNTKNFAPAAVNTTDNTITLSDATELVTGKPIIFDTTETIPSPLVAGTTYYAINVSSTQIKVATSALNASINNPIDITTQGTGTHRVRISYIFGNKDEIWKSGRKGMLTRFWNTDYRNPEASDYIKLPPTLDGQNAITAIGKLSNRMFIWTEHSMIKYDGNNINVIRNDIGCVAHRSISYYDSYMVWMDNDGKIWARNEEAGSQDVISEAIQQVMDLVPKAQLPQAVAVCVGDTYKLYLGQIDGVSLRVVYKFRTNQWSIEWHAPKMPIALEYTYSSAIKPHFFDETGQLWVDEVGTDDNGKEIPFEAELGEDNFGMDEIKKYIGIKIYSKNSSGIKVFMSIDGDEFKEIAQITKQIESIAVPGTLSRGTTMSLKFVSSLLGDSPEIDKVTVWYNREEDTFRATQ